MFATFKDSLKEQYMMRPYQWSAPVARVEVVFSSTMICKIPTFHARVRFLRLFRVLTLLCSGCSLRTVSSTRYVRVVEISVRLLSIAYIWRDGGIVHHPCTISGIGG